MRKPIKYAEKVAVAAAKGVWFVFDRLNRINPNPSPTPKWSDKPLLKSYERTAPPLGFPRETDSLCPTCVKEVRNAVITGEVPLDGVRLREDQGALHGHAAGRLPGTGGPAASGSARWNRAKQHHPKSACHESAADIITNGSADCHSAAPTADADGRAITDTADPTAANGYTPAV